MKHRANLQDRLLGLAAALLLATLVWLSPDQQALAQATPTVPPPTTAPKSTPAASPDDIAQPIAKLTEDMAVAEKGLEDLRELKDQKDLETQLIQRRAEVQALDAQAQALILQLKPRLDAVRQQKGKLGQAPAKDAPPEAEAVAAERTRLTNLEQAIDGAIKRADSHAVRASQLVDIINQLQREQFTRSVLRRTNSPLLPTLWIDLVKESQKAWTDIANKLDTWWTIAGGSANMMLLLALGAGGVWLALRTAMRTLIRRYRDGLPGEPSFFARAATAAWVAAALALAPVVAILICYLGLDQLDVLHQDLDRIAFVTVSSVIAFSGVTALANALLVPRNPTWRLFDLSDANAARMRWLVLWIAGVYAIDQVLTEFSRIIYAPLSITIAQSFLAGVAFAGLLIALLRTPFGIGQARLAAADAAIDPTPRSQLDLFGPVRIEARWLKLPLWLVAIGIIGAAVLGYVSLARFISGQVVITGSILAALILLHHAVRALADDLIDVTKAGGRWLNDQIGLKEDKRRRIATLFSLIVQGGVLLLAGPLILLQWGFDWQIVKGWLTAAVFGFKIGSIEISLARILLAAGILAGGFFATRMLQRSLDQTILHQPRMDAGIANSIRTAVGYLGIGAAALIAVSYAGLDFTNLAIVAGALSVGIGFGLQSVVNNFVSGLILLVERPIKVGDWIVVGTDEGYVRRISVRSTEIETFDRSSVIIPNAELIQGRVKNWTLRDPVGRVRIPVGIDYGADPAQAREILLALAARHPGVLKSPAPGVSFEGFGQSSIDLSLRVFVADVTQGGGVRTDLAFEILRAFRAAGISMPFPQTEVHLRDLAPFKAVLQRVIEERRVDAEKKPAPNAPTSEHAASKADAREAAEAAERPVSTPILKSVR